MVPSALIRSVIIAKGPLIISDFHLAKLEISNPLLFESCQIPIGRSLVVDSYSN